MYDDSGEIRGMYRTHFRLLSDATAEHVSILITHTLPLDCNAEMHR